MKLVPLTRGYFAQVDDEDYPYLSQFKWYATVHKRRDGTIKAVYAGRSIWVNGKWRTQRMHTVLAGKGADHKDGDGLNNQRHNLRSATSAQNEYNQGLRCNNTSGFKGVSWHRQRQRWQAKIAFDGDNHFLGLFDTAVEAAKAYNATALVYHGGFARLNNIPEEVITAG